MKKLLCTIFLVLTGTALFGNDFSLSAGAGGILGGLFTRYTITVEGSWGSGSLSQEVDQFNYGFFGFFDATYGVFTVSFQNGHNNYKESDDNNVLREGKGWESMLGIGLLGKYPFKLNEQFTVFPMLGIEYQISLVQLRTDPDDNVYRREDGRVEFDKDENAFKATDWNSFFINVGGGADYTLPKNFYLRGELLCGFRLMTPYEKKNLDMMKSLTGDSNPKLGGITVVPTFRISAGYKFYTKTKPAKSKPVETEPTITPIEPTHEAEQELEPVSDDTTPPPRIESEALDTRKEDIENKILRTRQEMIERGFVEYDRENFDKADEIALSALDTYEDGDEETAFALAEAALLRYNDILQNGWASYAAARRVCTAEERENALAKKANIAVRYLFRDAEALYKKAEDNFDNGNYAAAGVIYLEAETLYVIAGQETDEKRQKAQNMLKMAEEKIEESEKIME